MKKIILSTLIIIPAMIFAQQKKVSNTADLSLAFGSGFSVAPSYFHNWQIGKKGKLELGVGARLTSFFGSKLYYETAPAKITSGKTGPGVLFAETNYKNVDSLLIPKANTNSLNLAIEIGYNLSSKWYAAVNIDAIGFTFGGKKSDVSYIRDGGSPQPLIVAKPTSFNALLISDNDRGSLNSEIYVRYKLKERLGIHGGASFNFSEYTTNAKIQQVPQPNDRFRNKSLGGMIGITLFLK